MHGTSEPAMESEERGVRLAVRDDPGAEGGTVQYLRRDSARSTREVDCKGLEGGVQLPTGRQRHG